jgi:hypothetical protein
LYSWFDNSVDIFVVHAVPDFAHTSSCGVYPALT